MSSSFSSSGHTESIRVDDHKVACNGGGGALGHPKVFYEMGADDEVVCRYCDRHFILIGGKADQQKP